MALQLSPEEFATIKEEFSAIDIDGDGQLTKDELTAYFGQEKQEKVDFMMKVMDLDRSGTIEFHEYLEMAAFLECNKGITEEKIKTFFRALDKDGNGVLSTDEIRSFYKMISDLSAKAPLDDETEELIKSLDINGDGKVDYDEFAKGYFKL